MHNLTGEISAPANIVTPRAFPPNQQIKKFKILITTIITLHDIT